MATEGEEAVKDGKTRWDCNRNYKGFMLVGGQ